MKAIILAAGYATRLYPLTRDFPKPLLVIGDRSILDSLVDQLTQIDGLREIILVSNSRFLAHFRRWSGASPRAIPVRLLDDGSTCNEDRLGALGDLRIALEHAGHDDDVLVSAADNILQFQLTEFVASFQARRACQIGVHRITDPARLRRTGIAVLGEGDRVMEFAEKPREPKTHWAVPPLYIVSRESLPRIRARLLAGGPTDAPGHLIEWLCGEMPVFAHRIQGTILDIGTPESLDAARRSFRRHGRNP